MYKYQGQLKYAGFYFSTELCIKILLKREKLLYICESDEEYHFLFLLTNKTTRMEIIKNLRVIEFYSYPTAVCKPIEQYSEREKTPRGDSKVMSLFLACLGVAEKKLKRHLSDNKIAMKVRYTYGPFEIEFFVGYKDLVWTIGQSLNPYMVGQKETIEEDI